MRRIVKHRVRPQPPSRVRALAPYAVAATVAALVTCFVLFALVSGLWWVVRWEYAKWRLEHGTANERSAHATMHVIRTAARKFEDAKGRPPRTLDELRAEKLLDASSASGHRDGYRFRIVPTREDYLLVAEPETKADELHFGARARWKVCFGTAPVGDPATGELNTDTLYLGY